MAGSVNKVILLGRLGGDPEIRVSQEGTKIARFSVATSESWKDKTTNEKKEKTDWHKIVIFSAGLSEIVEKFLKKGSLVYLEGQIRSRKFNDQAGVEKTTTEIILQGYNCQLTMLDNKSDDFQKLNSPNIENSSVEKIDESPQDFDIEDEVLFKTKKFMIDDSKPENIENESIFIEREMENSFLDYAMSVIVSRALPDVCDGLKPVHRRIIYAMNEAGYTSGKPSRKSARIVGDVMGKYHPHGDSAIYDAMVRLAQDFSMRVPLIDGQGNFGSMDGDSAAAMRYTEAKLSPIASFLVNDIDNETVNFKENYDGTAFEPELLPAEFPNLLINGSEGIAVGMATKIPPHCPNEIIDACCKIILEPNVSDEDLLDLVKGPDFPTGGIIVGKTGIKDAYSKGKGSIIIRAKTSVENSKKGRESIIISEIPYSIKKSQLIENIAKVAKEKIIDGISELRDESNREGVRVVIDLKRDVQADVVMNQLYKFTSLQTSFGINMLALNNGVPELLNLRRYLELFTKFRKDVVYKRTKYHLKKTREKHTYY